MSYDTSETALAAILHSGTLDKLDERDVAKGEYGILSEGGHYYAVVLDYDSFSRARLAQEGGYLTTWRIELFCAVQFIDEKQVRDDMVALRQELITVVSENPGLGIDVYNAEIVDGTAVPQLIDLGGANWAFELMYAEVTEQDSYTEAD